MEEKIFRLKEEFNIIMEIRNNVKNTFDILQIKIDKLKQLYNEYIKTNKNDSSIFGLDSFHFQNKLIDIEYADMKRLFLAINNRMYCEYYKLNKQILEYINKSLIDKKLSDVIKVKVYPVYKDLEPFKEYKLELIKDIHENIFNLLNYIISYIINKETELVIHKKKLNTGLNIDNFISSFKFNINITREKIMMFVAYVDFYHKMHSKNLKRFNNKIQLMYTNINNDIKLDDSLEISKNKKKELIKELKHDNKIDKSLLNEIKISIGSETNSETDSIDSPIRKHTNSSSESYENIFTKDAKSIMTHSTCEPNKKVFKHDAKHLKKILKLNNRVKDVEILDTQIEKADMPNMFASIESSCDNIINDNCDNSSARTLNYSSDGSETSMASEIFSNIISINDSMGRKSPKNIIKIGSEDKSVAEEIVKSAKTSPSL